VETEQFLRARVQNALFVFWKQPPTIEALDTAISTLRQTASQQSGRAGLAIVSLSQQSPSQEASAHASRLGRQWGSEIAVLVMAQEARGFSAKINRVLLRTLMAVAGGLSKGPKNVAFVDTPEQAVEALERGMREAGILELPPGELTKAGAGLIARCRGEAN
jgi:hypothetical protein